MCPRRIAGDAVVARAVSVQLARSRRARSVRYSALNAALLLVLAYDLSCKCPGYTSLMHYVELGAASVLCANLLQHLVQLLPERGSPTCITTQQRQLLALSDADLDSSFRIVDSPPREAAPEPAPAPAPEELSLSLSPARSWRVTSPATPPPSPPGSPGSPPGSPASSGSAGDHDRSLRDEFIADRDTLHDYLKQYAERARQEGAGVAGAGGGGVAGEWGVPAQRPLLAPPHYALATLDTESLPAEERGGGADGMPAGAGALGGNVRVWWRLRLDPLRLTQFNLNLRLWIQMTILTRLVRALEAADAALDRLGLPNKLGQVSTARLRALSEGAAPALAALLPYLEPFPDQQYAVQRIRELSRGGCLSAYKWCGGGGGGGREWEPSKPTDAELLLHLFATYMDGQLPGAGGRPFSDAHLSAGGGGSGSPPAGAAPAPPRALALALAIHRVSQRPPHYVLLLKGETLDVGRGRNNLLHTLLLFVAAAARDPPPPALRRLQLGPAGLNILWVIGR